MTTCLRLLFAVVLLSGPALAQRPVRQPATPADGGSLPAPPLLGKLSIASTGLARSSAGCQVHFADGRMIFWTRETAQDLDGDGDALDDLVVGYDLATGGIDVVEFAPNDFCPPFAGVSGRWLVGAVTEFDPLTLVPLVDLNGDGDTADAVLHTHDFGAGASTNTGLALANAFSYQLAGDHLVSVVDEAGGFGDDINGDGDTLDLVNLVTHLSTGRFFLLIPPGADVDTGGALTDGTVTLVAGVRFGGGPEHLFSVELVGTPVIPFPVWTDLGPLGSPFAMRPAYFLLRVDELDYGGDLNGDGDADDDSVNVLYDRAAGSPVLPGLSGPLPVAFAADRIYVASLESQHGDLNGDGDSGDVVLQSYAVDGTIRSLGLQVNGTVRGTPFEDGLAVPVWENQQGADLNGDGDQSDFVVHVFDERSDTLHNLGLPLDFLLMDLIRVSERRIAFPVDEADQGEDLDGDGMADGQVMFVYNADANLAFDTRLAGVHAHLHGPRLLVQTNTGLRTWNRGALADFGPATFLTGQEASVYFTVAEILVGQDLDGDGLLQSNVVHHGALR